jgi:transcriptional regulator with PAS, ATPase and Fis domain
MTMEEVEMAHLLRVLDKHNGNKQATALELGISLKTIYNKLSRLAERRAAG